MTTNPKRRGCRVGAVTRWAIYARDKYECLYCRKTLAEIVAGPEGNFMTLEHARVRSHGGDNTPDNLFAACYECNCWRGRRTIAAVAAEMGVNKSVLNSRIMQRRRRGLGPFRLVAEVALGRQEPWVIQEFVREHDLRVQRHFSTWLADEWEHVQNQRSLWCRECARPLLDVEAGGEIVAPPLDPF